MIRRGLNIRRRTALGLALAAAGAPLLLALPARALDRTLTDTERTLIEEINAYNSSIRTMVGRFLQIDTQGGRTEGTFFIERPNKVRFRYNPPSREEIISVGRGFYVIDRRERTQYAYPQDRIPLRQFLAEKIDLLAANNVTEVVSSDDYLSVTIADETPIGLILVALIFDVQSRDLVQWSLTEPSGAELTFSLYDIEKNLEIPKSYFYIDPTYRGIEAPTEDGRVR